MTATRFVERVVPDRTLRLAVARVVRRDDLVLVCDVQGKRIGVPHFYVRKGNTVRDGSPDSP